MKFLGNRKLFGKPLFKGQLEESTIVPVRERLTPCSLSNSASDHDTMISLEVEPRRISFVPSVEAILVNMPERNTTTELVARAIPTDWQSSLGPRRSVLRAHSTRQIRRNTIISKSNGRTTESSDRRTSFIQQQQDLYHKRSKSMSSARPTFLKKILKSSNLKR